MKGYRQAAILECVDREAVTSQEMLRRRVKARGFDVTQATLSRDLKELGLVKRAADGAYQRPGLALGRADHGEAALRRAVAEYLRHVDRVEQLIVVRTEAGQAQPLALAIDRASAPEVVGTIAGDDTILVIARNRRQAETFVRRIEAWARA